MEEQWGQLWFKDLLLFLVFPRSALGLVFH